jgi:hypothetical protein
MKDGADDGGVDQDGGSEADACFLLDDSPFCESQQQRE